MHKLSLPSVSFYLESKIVRINSFRFRLKFQFRIKIILLVRGFFSIIKYFVSFKWMAQLNERSLQFSFKWIIIILTGQWNFFEVFIQINGAFWRVFEIFIQMNGAFWRVFEIFIKMNNTFWMVLKVSFKIKKIVSVVEFDLNTS